MATTQQLEIDIKAKSDKATTSLDALISKLNEVNSALNGLNTAKISQISNDLKGLKSVNINGNNGSGSNGKNAYNSNATVSANNRAKSSFERLLGAITGTNKGMLSFRKTMLNMAATWGMFYASMYPVIRLFKFFGSKVEDAMDYTETYNYFKVTMGKIGHDAGEEFANDFLEQLTELNKKMTGFKLGSNGELLETGDKSLGIDPEQLMQFQAKIGSITNSVGLLGQTSVTTQKALSMLASDFSSLKNEDLDQVMTKMTSGLIGQSRAWYSYGVDITNASLKQIAFEHGVTKSVSAMSQAEKMQLRLLAILDKGKVAWADQANTISSVANQYRMLKQQVANLGRTLGNLFLPIVNKVLPYVNALVIVLRKMFTSLGFKLHGDNWLTDISDGISEGNFSGLEEDIEDTADALDDATKSAKKFKQATMGFDELNIISPDSSSGSGTAKGGIGGGFNLDDDIEKAFGEYEKAWNEAWDKMQNKAEQLANRFMKYVDSSNWFGLGNWIGTSLTTTLASVPWENIYQGARDFGTGLAQFLNGLISPDLFNQVGITIAGSLNTALYFLKDFAWTFDWVNLGESIASEINGFFKTFDFEALAKTLNTWVDGLESALGAAINGEDGIDWKSVFSGFYDFLSNLEIDTIGAIVGILIIIKKIIKIEIGKAIGDFVASSIGSLLSKFTLTGMLKWIIEHAPHILAGTPAFDVIAGEMIAQIDDALTRLFPSLSKVIGEGLLGAVGGALSGLWSGLVAGFEGGGLAGGIIGAIVGSLNAINPNIFKWDWTEEWVDKAIDSFKKIGKTKWYNFVEIGGYIFEGIIEGFIAAFSFITEPISRFFIELGKALADVFGIHSPAKNMMPFGEFIFLGILEGFKAKFDEWKKAINDWYERDVKPWFSKDKWLALGQGIKDGLADKWNEFAKWWKNTGFAKWWTEDVSPWFTIEKWQVFGQNIHDALKSKWDAFVDWWSTTGIVVWWTKHVEPWFDEKKWTFEGIEKGMKAAWNNAITSIKIIWNKFADFLNDSMNIHIDALVNPLTGNEIWGARDIQLAKVPKFTIPAYSIGGFPEDGLFYANHNELVGQFNNGQTTVANNEQIIAGIQNGVAQAVHQELAPILRQIATNTGDTANNTDAIAKKPVQSITDRGIAKANLRGQRSLGLQLRTT